MGDCSTYFKTSCFTKRQSKCTSGLLGGGHHLNNMYMGGVSTLGFDIYLMAIWWICFINLLECSYIAPLTMSNQANQRDSKVESFYNLVVHSHLLNTVTTMFPRVQPGQRSQEVS